jgi:hypothetical protein
MNLHRQLTRASVALLAIAGIAAAERLLAPARAECPLAKAPVGQRILLLDPVHKHPMWIDARFDAHGIGMLRFDRTSGPSRPSRGIRW